MPEGLRHLPGLRWGIIIFILLAYSFLPQAIDALGPQADKYQNRCTKIGVPGDPDLIPRPNPGAVKIIRLTNDGQFVDRCQLTDALYELNWDMPQKYGRPPIKSDAVNLPRLTVLYVHGWKHDASPTDSDLVAFTQLIQTLQKKYEGKKQLLGIYISWNASNGLGVLDNLSFWSKKSIADRISQSAVVTKIIATIGTMRKIDDQRMDQFMAIGHSFGARMVFSATSQLLVTDASRSHPEVPFGQYKTIPGSADAVILLNPAFEASLYTALDSFCRETEAFPADQAPLLISIATDNDWATGRAFPVGQWLGMFRTDMDTTTLGNFEQYRTHSLFKADVADCMYNDRDPAALTESFAAAGLCLMRDPPTRDDARRNKVRCPHSPFLVVGTTKDVIDGHNGIWNDQFSKWMSELIAELELSRQPAEKRTAGGLASTTRAAPCNSLGGLFQCGNECIPGTADCCNNGSYCDFGKCYDSAPGTTSCCSRPKYLTADGRCVP